MFISDDDGGFSTFEMLIIISVISLFIYLKKKIEVFFINRRTKKKICLLCKNKIPEYHQHYWYRSPNMKIPKGLKAYSHSRLELLGIEKFYLCEGCVEIIDSSIHPKDN